MKLRLQTGRVRWWLVAACAGSFIVGMAFATAYLLLNPIRVDGQFKLPNSFILPT